MIMSEALLIDVSILCQVTNSFASYAIDRSQNCRKYIVKITSTSNDLIKCRGVSTYRQKRKGQNIGRLYHRSDGS